MTGVQTTNLPTDSAGNAVPTLALKPGGGVKVSCTATTARTSADFSTGVQVVTLLATENMYIEFGGSTVEANTTTSHYLAKNVYLDITINDRSDFSVSRVACIRDTTDGVLHISERI